MKIFFGIIAFLTSELKVFDMFTTSSLLWTETVVCLKWFWSETKFMLTGAPLLNLFI